MADNDREDSVGDVLFESPNYRPGEPLRSWLVPTPVVKVDAMAVVGTSRSRDALARLIADQPLSLEDRVALGRLISVSVGFWYEPPVTMWDEPIIDPEVAAFFTSLFPKF
jgi:hypothetical protein